MKYRLYLGAVSRHQVRETNNAYTNLLKLINEGQGMPVWNPHKTRL